VKLESVCVIIFVMLQTLKKVFGDENSRHVKKLWPIVYKVNSWEDSIKPLSDEQLRAKTA